MTAAVVTGMAGALLSAPIAQAAPLRHPRPATEQEPSSPFTKAPVPAAAKLARPANRVVRPAWPSAGTASLTLPAGTRAGVAHRVGTLPVLLTNASAPAGTTVRVQLASRSSTAQAGVQGVLLTATATAPAGAAATASAGVRVAVDYTSFAAAGGADFASRLHLVRLPGCALSTPTLAACRVQTPLASINDAPTSTVQAAAPLTMNQPMVLAAVAGPSGPNGAFTASSLSPSGSWTTSGSSGSFNWSYPVAVPPSATGADVSPSVALSYNSASIDGEIATSNNQSSWVGEGWDYNPGYIERTYRTCSDTAAAGDPSYTADQCWAGQIVTLNLGGSTTALVRDDATGSWHVQNDQGQKVELLSGASNGAHGGEYWKVTTQDGISYVFGLNVLPGDSSADATNSTLVEPVYAAHSTDPCYNASFAVSVCNQAWRWNLDYVVDPHGNATAYYYDKQTNNYGADGATTPVSYDSASTLSHIDYGLREVNGSITAHPATNRISFTTQPRCFATDCSYTAANADNWPDTPQDQSCAPAPALCNNHAPTFFSTLRLSSIQTGYYNGTGPYFTVDRYDLGQSFPTAGDPELELDSISHTGYSATGVASSPLTVSFISELLANRVPDTNNQPDMYFWRMNQITSETGVYTQVSYGQPNGQDCTASTLPSDPANDHQLCFPVKWTPPRDTDPILDYFQKYLVTEVQMVPHDGRSPTQVTDYAYLGTPAWHADDNEVVTPAQRSYGQFRGYGQVETRGGNTGFSYNGTPDQQTLTRTTYYRGMGGTVSDSLSETTPDNDEYAGLVRETQTYEGSGGSELSASITDQATTATTASRARSGLPALTANIVAVARGRDITDEPGISPTATRTATSSYTYDTLGRLVQQTDSADDGVVATTCTTTTYADPIASNTRYIRDRVAEKIVSQQSCPTLGSTPSPVLSDVRTYYDSTATTAGVTSYGDATRIDTRLDSGATGVTPYFGKTISTFDTAGRPLSATAYVNAADTTGRTTSTSYIPSLPALPASASTTGPAESMAGPLTQNVVTNPKLQTVTTTIDPGRGLPILVHDIAGHDTFADYDSLGRLTAVWKPGQTHGTNPATNTYSYLIAATGPSAVTTNTLIDNGDGATHYKTSIELLDSFGQSIQTQTDAVGGGRILTDTFRDSHGWPVDTNNRWYDQTSAPGTSLANVADSAVQDRTETSYDGAGRTIRSTEYDGLTETWHTQTIYGGNETTVIPPTGAVATSTFTDAHGNTSDLRQYTGIVNAVGDVVSGAAQDTGYLYTALGQQKEIDSAGRAWTTKYDLGGRALTQTDPDTGTTSKTYDDLGEMLTSTDANSVLLSYTYDGLGRKTAEYHTTTQTAANEVDSWLYDTVQNGQLSSSTHYVNSTTKYTVATGSYDSAGNPLSTIVSLPSTETGFAASYTTSYTWTSTHLRTSVTPAAGGGLPTETIGTNYDTFGDPISFGGSNTYVGTSTYSVYGEPLQYQLGGNLQTSWLTYTPDPQTRRLTEVNLSTQTAVPQVEDLNYSYDPAGNMTKSIDVQGNGTSAPTETQCYTYDSLDRLSQAWSATDNCAADPTSSGNATIGGPQPYWSSWSFTAAGARASQTQHAITGPATGDKTTSYTYATAGHADALTATTGALASGYTVDPVGNVKTRTLTGANLTMTYDLTNQTASIAGAGGTSSYFRDADGNLLTRHDPTSTTVYLPGEELTRTTATGAITGTRYYSIGGTEVAVRAMAINPNSSFLLADPHGTNQTSVQTVGTGIGAITRRHFDPYGNPLSTTSGTWPDKHAFLDKPTDATSGTSTVTAISDIGAREYDPTTGRFLTADPILDPNSPQSLNGYTYANNNPITNSDPSGLHTDDPRYGTHDNNYAPEPGGGNGSEPAPAPGANTSNSAAANVTCLYTTGSQCQSPGIKILQTVQERQLQDWLAFDDAMQKALDPCHGNDRCQIQNTLATVSGVKGCFKQGSIFDCATLVPIGKVLKGGEVVWDGVRLLRVGGRVTEEVAHADEIAARIANGHGWTKHLDQGDLPAGVTTRTGYAGVVHDTILNGDIRVLERGRFAFWKDGTVVIIDPANPDFGSAFVPTEGLKYFLGQTANPLK